MHDEAGMLHGSYRYALSAGKTQPRFCEWQPCYTFSRLRGQVGRGSGGGGRGGQGGGG